VTIFQYSKINKAHIRVLLADRATSRCYTLRVFLSKKIFPVNLRQQNKKRSPRHCKWQISYWSVWFGYVQLAMWPPEAGAGLKLELLNWPSCNFLLITFVFVQIDLPALTYPPMGHERSTFSDIDPLHGSSAFWVRALWMLDVGHARCIQLQKRKTLLRVPIKAYGEI